MARQPHSTRASSAGPLRILCFRRDDAVSQVVSVGEQDERAECDRQEAENDVIRLRAREYEINDAEVWHRADVQEHATALFVTAGIGTQIRDL